MLAAALTNLITRTAALSPWPVMLPTGAAWTLYGFRPASAGPFPCRVVPNLEYAHTPTGPLCLDLYLPDGVDSRLAGVMLIHGGGWEIGSKAFHRGLGRLLATHGFLAAAVDYRLLPAATWPACLDDCRQALRWLRREAPYWGLDPGRLALLGDSAGAHLASLLGLEMAGAGEAVRGVVAYFGPFDLTRPAWGCWPRRCQQHLLGGAFTDRAVMARARAASPVYLVTPESPPFLLVHGTIDAIVPPLSSELMAKALREAGVAVETLWVQGADHGLLSLGRIKPTLAEIDRAVVSFLQRATA